MRSQVSATDRVDAIPADGQLGIRNPAERVELAPDGVSVEDVVGVQKVHEFSPRLAHTQVAGARDPTGRLPKDAKARVAAREDPVRRHG
jgi:hypothetical protein